MKPKVLIGGITLLAVLITGYFYLDNMLFDGVKPRPVRENGIRATFFAKEGISKQPTVVLMGGGDYWGQEFAKAGYASLGLPYYRQEGLPPLLEEIPLEYVADAIAWLREQPEVDSDKIIVMGASRNAELALVAASYLPELIHGVIAYAPSSVSWSNTIHAFNSDEIKPTWTYKGKPVPFIPMPKLAGGEAASVETLPYWQKGLADSNAVAQASIRVEDIHGPILLFSGLADEVWPAASMSDRMEERISNSAFPYEFENIQYEDAGHLISGNPNHLATTRQGSMAIAGKNYTYNFGGTAEGDMAAQKDAYARVFIFLSGLRDG